VLAQERRGWKKELPSIRDEEVNIHPLSAVQHENFLAELGQIENRPTRGHAH
jgi:hypothetical protein